MPAHNPFMGAAPVMSQVPGGGNPSGGDTSTGRATLGALGPGKLAGASTPAALGTLVLASAAVILAIHIAGIRTHFTVSAGRGS